MTFGKWERDYLDVIRLTTESESNLFEITNTSSVRF